MPYITQQAREQIAKGRQPENAGELNYAITCLLLNYVDAKGARYQTFNDIAGALDNAKAEFYRRKVAPYEDQKAKENGDVY